jgi:peptidoglycan-associated lipoprotein
MLAVKSHCERIYVDRVLTIFGGNMKLSRVIVVSLLMLFMASCSSSRRGTGSPDGYDGLDEGRIPVAGHGQALADINFAFDSSALSGPAKDILKRNAQWMLANPRAKVIVEGHCDERGTAEYNLALGERRAKAAYDYLRSLGVPASQMSTISYGEELPLDPGRNEAAYARNRRAHFAVTK